MDETSIQRGVTTPRVAETALQAGPPPLGANGAAKTEPQPQAARHPVYRALVVLADLRITVTLFVLAMLLVFWGTLAQADFGNWTIVNRYFRNWIVMVPVKVLLFNLVDNKIDAIPFPAGLTIGTAMLVNLLAAHAVRFKLAWNRAGIILIHVGIIVMMAGEWLTYMYANESLMQIDNGQTVNYTVDIRHAEFAVIRNVDAKKDEVVTVPAHMLKPGAKIRDERLPFEIEVLDYMVNSTIEDVRRKDGRERPNEPDIRGNGKLVTAHLRTEFSGVDQDQKVDTPSAYVRLSQGGKNLGVWLVSAAFSPALEHQFVTTPDGKQYDIALRHKVTTRPYSVHLYKVKTIYYPGTENPKDFRSFIRVIDPANKVDRDVQISMNAPMHYEGETFYQSQVLRGDSTTVLQVVRNPGWSMPYLSCAIVGIGLMMHFGLMLYKFIDRRVFR